MQLHANPVRDQISPEEYTVKVNGQTLDLFKASAQVKIRDDPAPFAFGSFDMDAEAVVEITSRRDLSRAEILPENSSVQPVVRTPHKLTLKAGKPFILSIEPEGRIRLPLLLFGKPPEKDIPRESDPNVIRFGPGEHFPGRIELKSNQTLYLGSGALVHGVLNASGNHIRVCGRGVLSQERFPRGYADLSMDFRHCRDLTIEGIISKDPCFWNLVLRDCENVRIDGIALCGGRMINDDAADICNCRNVRITNCFFRAQDDVIAVKGEADLPRLPNNPGVYCQFGTDTVLDPRQFGPERAVEDVEVSDSVFWNDSANVFRIGFECTAPRFSRLRFHDIEVIHTAKECRSRTDFWSNNIFMLQASCAMPMEDISFERIRIHSDGQGILLASLRSEECDIWKKPGFIRRCLFRDVAVTGKNTPSPCGICLRCGDGGGCIEDVTFQNVVCFGRRMTADDAPVWREGDAEMPLFPVAEKEKKVLHVFNGDCAAEAWKKAVRSPESFLVWRENYLEGPLPPAGTPRETFARIRGEFLHGCVPQYSAGTLTRFQCSLEETLQSLNGENLVMLWFDDCMFDIMLLARILFLLENSPAEIRLCCEYLVLGTESELFRTPPSGFREVTPEIRRLYADLWRAVTEGSAALDRFARSGRPDREPALKRALLRYAADHPADGRLGLTERKLLDLIAGGVHEFSRIFRAFNASEERPFMGDTMCERLLKSLEKQGYIIRRTDGEKREWTTLPKAQMKDF